MYDTEWIIDTRQPMGGPQQVVEYLGRYTHKVAISNHRIKYIEKSMEQIPCFVLVAKRPHWNYCMSDTLTTALKKCCGNKVQSDT